MANCPVDGSDRFLHLSCVMDDMMSIVYAPAFYVWIRKMQGLALEVEDGTGARQRARRVLTINVLASHWRSTNLQPRSLWTDFDQVNTKDKRLRGSRKGPPDASLVLGVIKELLPETFKSHGEINKTMRNLEPTIMFCTRNATHAIPHRVIATSCTTWNPPHMLARRLHDCPCTQGLRSSSFKRDGCWPL